MFRFIWRTILGRRERSMLLVLGVLIVSVAFGLLLGAVQTTQITVDEDLAQYWRTTYDILVRPTGVRSPIEDRYGLVQANHLSNLPGGISLAQYEAIKAMPGVEVAAPIAMLGNFKLMFHAPLDVTCEPGFYRLSNQVVTDDGLQQYLTEGAEYFYCADAGGPIMHLYNTPQYNLLVSMFYGFGTTPNEAPWFEKTVYKLPVLLAAVDPEQERRLLALDKAMVEGEYIHDLESLQDGGVSTMIDPNGSVTTRPTGDIPLIVNARSYVSFTLQTEWDRLELSFSPDILDEVKANEDALRGLPTAIVQQWSFAGDEAYRAALEMVRDADLRMTVNGLNALPGGLAYEEIELLEENAGPALKAVPLGSGLSTGGIIVINMPLTAFTPEMRFRETGLGSGLGGDLPFLLQGTYDIERLPRPDAVSEVPLETYFPPRVVLRYDADGEPTSQTYLGPTFSDAGYITSPPLALTTLEAGSHLNFQSMEAPISAIRVRVEGVNALTSETREKIVMVAAAIIEETELTVDITVGSSPRRALVYLSGSEDIPPAGYVEEGWVQKGINYTIGREIKHINVVLFGVMLVVAGLYMLNTSAISTLARRQELALLKAIGWRTVTVLGTLLAEGLFVGIVSGGLGLGIALILARALSLDMPIKRAFLILPIAVVLTLLGTLAPAVIASRASPAQALRQGEIRRTVLPLSVFSLPGYAWRQAARRPIRAALVVLTTSVAASLFTLFLAIVWRAQGYLSGTLLGEFVLLRIDPFHFIIAAVSLIVAGFATADVLLIGVIERRREVGMLKAIGWQDRFVFRLFLWEAEALALTGGSLAWLLTMAAYWYLYRALPLWLIALLLPALLVPAVVSLIAAIYPARLAASVPPAVAMRYE